MRSKTDTVDRIWHPSPNFGPRRDGLAPELIVIHYTAMDSAQAALNRLCDPMAEVSAHYLIGMDGALWHLVDESERAWHAGAGEWHGKADVNSRSIGIELDNRGDHPFPEPQMKVLETLLCEVLARWNIPPAGVIGHSDMAPGRKHDPGPRFDWLRLEQQNLAGKRAKAPPAQHPSFAELKDRAIRAGYTAQVDEQTLLDAIRLRYRPAPRGPLSRQDLAPLKP